MKYKRSSFRPTTVRLWGFIYALRGRRFYEREFYERKAGVPTFDVHGTAVPAHIPAQICGCHNPGCMDTFKTLWFRTCWCVECVLGAELITAVCAAFIYRGAVRGQREVV